jgi:hypothetical protein
MTPRWLLLSEPESTLAIMNRHAFLRMKFTQKATIPGFGNARIPIAGSATDADREGTRLALI